MIVTNDPTIGSGSGNDAGTLRFALHGSGTICDFASGGIIERLHLSKAVVRGSTTEVYTDTDSAKSMAREVEVGV